MDRPKSRSPAITEARPSSAFPQKHPATSPNVVQLAKVGQIHAILFDKEWYPGRLPAHLGSGGSGGDAASRKRQSRGLRSPRGCEPFCRGRPAFPAGRSPLIAEPTSVFGVRWATALGRPASAEFFAEIDQLLCDATTEHLAAIGDPKTLLSCLADRGYRLGMITNDAESTARAHARTLGVDKYLEFVAGYDSSLAPNRTPDRSSHSRRPFGVPAFQKPPSSAIRFLTLPPPALRALSPSVS